MSFTYRATTQVAGPLRDRYALAGYPPKVLVEAPPARGAPHEHKDYFFFAFLVLFFAAFFFAAISIYLLPSESRLARTFKRGVADDQRMCRQSLIERATPRTPAWECARRGRP